MDNYIFQKNCSFREWYNHYKDDIIKLFYFVLDWIEEEDLGVYETRKGFYRNFVYFVYKNSVPYIYIDEVNR